LHLHLRFFFSSPFVRNIIVLVASFRVFITDEKKEQKKGEKERKQDKKKI
jgi:hypothetical protein